MVNPTVVAGAMGAELDMEVEPQQAEDMEQVLRQDTAVLRTLLRNTLGLLPLLEGTIR
jgi:hypothetical protein